LSANVSKTKLENKTLSLDMICKIIFRKINFILIFHLASLPVFSQGLSAYSDYKNYFYAFDNGVSKQLEYLPVQWYKIGGNVIAYLDNSNNLKAYYKGEKIVLSEAAPAQCFVNDNMIIYATGKVLSVFENGNTTLLSGWTSNLVIGDSIVGCVDQNASLYKIYYNGQVRSLPDAIDNASVASFRAGDNILAYRSMDGYLKIYYKNQVFNTEVYQPSKYQAGANTVAFVNESTQEFSVFYKGAVTILENQPPLSFSVADDMVAYVDNNRNFKVFYNGEKTDLAPFAPDFYTAEDNILAYSDNVNFNVFYKGKTYSLGRNIPKDFKINLSTLVFKDTQGLLNVFFDGKTDLVSNEKTNNFQLTGNTLKFSNSLNESHFFVNRKLF
jgi:hypothetical protein